MQTKSGNKENKRVIGSKSMLAVLLISGLLLISGCSAQLNQPKIELSTKSFNLGDINPDNGKVKETFFVKNTGSAPLKIISVSTSCGCTEADVESEEILPGEQTKLIVAYDPSVHPGLIGEIKRVVYIQSNDPLQEEVELELVGNSLPSSNPTSNTSPSPANVLDGKNEQ